MDDKRSHDEETAAHLARQDELPLDDNRPSRGEIAEIEQEQAMQRKWQIERNRKRMSQFAVAGAAVGWFGFLTVIGAIRW